VIGRFLKDRKGYALPYTTMLIALVAMPMLVLSAEITRSLYINVHIQTAVDSACTAAVQAVDVPYFVDYGVIRIDPSNAVSYAQREFNATVARSNIEDYNPALTSVSINNNVVECRASAQMIWSFPGIAPLVFNVFSAAEAEARR
jgi:acyl CoA:acetate/3-ketoacid CoA transferase